MGTGENGLLDGVECKWVFERHLIHRFEEYASAWKSKQAGISNTEVGVTNILWEEMNAVLHWLPK